MWRVLKSANDALKEVHGYNYLSKKNETFIRDQSMAYLPFLSYRSTLR